MSLQPWEANSAAMEVFNSVKEKYHHPRLEQATIAVAFTDSKAFIRGRFNWGKVQKFSPLAKLWHPDNKKYDFLVVLSGDAWQDVLNINQRESWADLLLQRCDVEYEPETQEINGKKVVVKDSWGRVQYTNTMKYDEDGLPKYKVVPLDLYVFTENVRRYGVWVEEILNFKEAVEEKDTPQFNEAGNLEPVSC